MTRSIREFREVPASRGGILWNARDEAGRPVPAGIYLARTRRGLPEGAASFVLTR